MHNRPPTVEVDRTEAGTSTLFSALFSGRETQSAAGQHPSGPRRRSFLCECRPSKSSSTPVKAAIGKSPGTWAARMRQPKPAGRGQKRSILCDQRRRPHRRRRGRSRRGGRLNVPRGSRAQAASSPRGMGRPPACLIPRTCPPWPPASRAWSASTSPRPFPPGSVNVRPSCSRRLIAGAGIVSS